MCTPSNASLFWALLKTERSVELGLERETGRERKAPQQRGLGAAAIEMPRDSLRYIRGREKVNRQTGGRQQVMYFVTVW